MNKTELVSVVAEQMGASKAEAERYVNAVVDTVSGSLAKGDNVTLHGFGTLEVRERAARTGRNPQTGAALEIPASKTVGFKPAKALKESL